MIPLPIVARDTFMSRTGVCMSQSVDQKVRRGLDPHGSSRRIPGALCIELRQLAEASVADVEEHLDEGEKSMFVGNLGQHVSEHVVVLAEVHVCVTVQVAVAH